MMGGVRGGHARTYGATVVVAVACASLLVACSRVNAAYESSGTGGGGSGGGSGSLPANTTTTSAVPPTTGDGGASGGSTVALDASGGPDTSETSMLDPCRELVCDPNATCIDRGGDPECVCLEGWLGDGISCAQLDPLRVDTPCDQGDGDCMGAVLCPMQALTNSVQLIGDPKVEFEVVLRIRGFIEHHDYLEGTDYDWYNVGGTPDPVGRNIAELTIDTPSQAFYVNNGLLETLECTELDHELTVVAQGGAELSLYLDSADACAVRCIDLEIPGLYPANGNDEGHFVQLEALSITPIP